MTATITNCVIPIIIVPKTTLVLSTWSSLDSFSFVWSDWSVLAYDRINDDQIQHFTINKQSLQFDLDALEDLPIKIETIKHIIYRSFTKIIVVSVVPLLQSISTPLTMAILSLFLSSIN